MARYIDADKLIERIKRDVITLSKDAEEGKQFMIDHIGMNWFAPTEDVVSRSECEQCKEVSFNALKDLQETFAKGIQDVAREIFEEIEQDITLALNSNYKAKEEHIKRSEPYLSHFRDLVDGKICALCGIDDFLTELKKKYIGE